MSDKVTIGDVIRDLWRAIEVSDKYPDGRLNEPVAQKLARRVVESANKRAESTINRYIAQRIDAERNEK